jgi:hypothetical protein
MNRPKWSRSDQYGILRYINEKAKIFLPLEKDILELRTKYETDLSPIIKLIYESLKKLEIKYETEKNITDTLVQEIREPIEIIERPKEATCLDLAVLFCSICYGYKLLPVFICFKDHAIVAVCTDHDVDSEREKPRRKKAFCDPPTQIIIRDVEKIKKVLDNCKHGEYIIIECTGFSKTNVLSTDSPEGENRENGLLSFEKAQEAGRRQFETRCQHFQFAIDIHTAFQTNPELEPFPIDWGSYPQKTYDNLGRQGIQNPEKFFGREDQLDRLHKLLQQNKEVAITAAVVGMGGVGKTELAIQYARKHLNLNTYRGGVCWVTVSDFPTKLMEFTRTNNFISPSFKFDVLGPLKEQIQFCWNNWAKGDVLIVIDDVTDYISQVKPYLPADVRFKILMTSRKNLLEQEQSLPLGVLEEGAALDLLKSLLEDQRVERDKNTAKKLCEWLGCLPLGLELVGRYLKKNRDVTLAEILTELKEERLNNPYLEEADDLMNARLGVRDAFNLTWKLLDEDAQKLGCLLSLFDLPRIPWSLVTGIYQYCLGKTFKLRHLREARTTLSDWNLLKFEDEEEYPNFSIRLHPLIREFFQDKLENPEEFPEEHEIKRKFLECMLEQVRQILDSSEFTNPNLKPILDCLLQKPSEEEDNKSLIEFLNLLFRDYYSVQQYLYDTGYLETAIDKLENVKKYLEPLDELKAQVVIGKMLGHAYYNNDNLYGEQAIDNMMAAQKIAAEANQTENEDSQMCIWYQIFLLDHVRNLLSKLRSKHPDIYPELTYENLERQISILLPDTLEQTNTPPTPDDWFFVLRAAHYWGHRGNQVAFELEDHLSRLPFEIESQTVERLIQQGIHYYSLAAILRAVSLRLSFPEQYDQSLVKLLQETPYLPEWLTTWNPNLQANNNDFERFASPSQAVGDMAHQYRGIAVIQLWSYYYYACEELTQSELQPKLEDTRRVVDACIKLWEKAKEILVSNEQLIKYYTWIANLRVMLKLAEKTRSGEPIPDLHEEVIPEVNRNLDDLERKYGLVYEMARERVREQIQKFHQRLSQLPK